MAHAPTDLRNQYTGDKPGPRSLVQSGRCLFDLGRWTSDVGPRMLESRARMIEINIDPTLLQVGPLLITWHGFFTAVGVLAGITLAVKYGARLGFSEDDIMSVALWSVIGGIIGARLMHVIDQWDYYARDPLTIVKINEGGLAVFGMVIGGPVA